MPDNFLTSKKKPIIMKCPQTPGDLARFGAKVPRLAKAKLKGTVQRGATHDQSGCFEPHRNQI